ncbi:DNA repair protein REV1-like isoform X2 [Ornithodoros turicata]|uniref:DNA repair protein REV1-like isoform X2 n=1 Tax=Ornithodoros turicata TaxID=34597 RepID=UPI003138AEEC
MRGRQKNQRRFGQTGFEAYGGYMSAKIRKLEDQFQRGVENEAHESSRTGIFDGISVFVNGYTDPSAETIKRIMSNNGGTYQHYYQRKPNCYVIASSLSQAKQKELRDQVVSPKWISDSVAAGKLLPVSQYLLFSPSLKGGQQRIESVVQGSALEADQRSGIKAEAREDDKITVQNEKDSSAHHNILCSENTSAGHARSHNSGDPNFLEQFYSRSRLHHISTASIKLREYVEELRSNSSGVFEGAKRLGERLRSGPVRELYDSQDTVLMHIDMDCFFVSVGLRTRPELKGTPVAVCHAKSYDSKYPAGNAVVKEDSRSEVASCSYEARKAGVRSGMFLGQARKLCPSLRTIPYDFEGYDEVSKMLYGIVASYTLDIEAISCDELYADVSKLLHELQCHPEEFASHLRKEIEEKTLCTASAGLGPNMLAARVANRSAKPNGHRFVCARDLPDFFRTVSVKDLPGVGYKLQSELSKLHVETCEQLQAFSLESLRSKFGVKTGTCLYEHARGIDKRTLQQHKVRKSVSAEVNYGIRFTQEDDMNSFIAQLSKEVEKRLHEAKVRGRTITLKLKVRSKEAPIEPAKFMGHGSCDNIAKSANLLTATDDASVIAKECCNLAAQLSLIPEDIRGVGIQVGKLEQCPAMGCPRRTLLEYVGASTAPRPKQEPSIKDGVMRTSDDLPSVPCMSATTVTKSVGRTEERNQPQGQQGQSVALPEFSEIDQSVLESLPEEIRNEVLTMYKGRGQYGKQTKKPPQRQVGRPPKSSPQKSMPSCSLKSYMTSASTSSNVPKKVTLVDNISHVIEERSKSDELRQLLKEWIHSGEEILNSDIEAWAAVLTKVVHERNLEKVDHLLKFFYRHVEQTGNSKWRDAYMAVVNIVQVDILQEFGYFMKVQTF